MLFGSFKTLCNLKLLKLVKWSGGSFPHPALYAANITSNLALYWICIDTN